jgi:hypothetical protein
MNKTITHKSLICKTPGTLEFIDGKWWCIGEKISKKGKKNRQTKKKKIDRHKKRIINANEYQPNDDIMYTQD